MLFSLLISFAAVENTTSISESSSNGTTVVSDITENTFSTPLESTGLSTITDKAAAKPPLTSSIKSSKAIASSASGAVVNYFVNFVFVYTCRSV